ncbi:MAG: CHC2 zinc finger domain-containing protein [Candidatus Gastranaerophilaceae bacterium]|jgi:hypothetical protein
MINEHEHKQEVAEKIRDFKNEFQEEYQKERRVEYLKTVSHHCDGEIKKLHSDYEDSLKNDEDYINRAVLAEAIKIIEKQKLKCESELRVRFGDKTKHQDFQLKLERAKLRKIEEFIEVRNMKAICPFHDDKNPSFSIWKGKGHCFGCGWSGGCIDFIMKLKQMSFLETVEYLS